MCIVCLVRGCTYVTDFCAVQVGGVAAAMQLAEAEEAVVQVAATDTHPVFWEHTLLQPALIGMSHNNGAVGGWEDMEIGE